MENEWFKPAYYAPSLNTGARGYWLFPTRSKSIPGNVVGPALNQVNCHTVSSPPDGLLSVTQKSAIEPRLCGMGYDCYEIAFQVKAVACAGGRTGGRGKEVASEVESWRDLSHPVPRSKSGQRVADFRWTRRIVRQEIERAAPGDPLLIRSLVQ
jgi:hypothetical protein